MRAVIMRSYGGPEVLKLEEVARPAPLLTEVLVRVRAAHELLGRGSVAGRIVLTL